MNLSNYQQCRCETELHASTERRSAWDSYSRSARQEFPRVEWNTKSVTHCV